MANKTFRRFPISANVPDSNDVKNEYFNQYNWKGIDQSKNFLTVDQETFEDAKNVYIDENGVLTSRPPIAIPDNGLGDLQNVISMKQIEDILFILRKDNFTLDVYEFNNGIYSKIVSRNDVGNKLLLHSVDTGVYLFLKNEILFYDKNSKEIGTPNFHIPVTKIYAPGDVESGVESENLFGTQYQENYVVDTEFNLHSSAYDKTLKYEVDGIERDIEISFDYFYKLQSEFYNAPEDYLDDTNNRLFITISDLGQIALFSTTSGNILYSSDGIFFEVKGVISNEYDIRKIKFSNNGELLIFISSEVVFLLSVGADKNGVVRYPTPTPSIERKVYDVSFESSDEYVMAYYNNTIIYFSYYSENYQGRYAENVLSDSILNLDMIFIKKTLDSQDDLGTIVVDVNFTDSRRLDVFNIYYADIVDTPQTVRIDYIYQLGNMPAGKNFDARINGKMLTVGLSDTTKDYILRYDRRNKEAKKFTVYQNGTSETKDPCLSISQSGNYFLCRGGLYYVNDNSLEPLYHPVDNHKNMPIKITDKYLYYYNLIDPTVIFSNRLKDNAILYKIYNKPSEYSKADHLESLDSIFLTSGSNLYINQNVEKDGVNYLYFPRSNKHVMHSKIKAIHPISKTEMAIFLSDEIWYNTYQNGVYYYNKSKLQPDINGDSDILTLYDSTSILFPSKQGLILLKYQDFIAASEQATTELSFPVRKFYKELGSDIRLTKWKDYVFLTSQTNKNILIFDVRNASWWWWELPFLVRNLKVINDALYILPEDTSSFYVFTDRSNYRDAFNNIPIEWYFVSQKLHLNAPNYYKHITNLTLSSVETTEGKPLRLNLDITNYRKEVNGGKSENFEYTIDVVRTFIKRLNYAKVCEFQYKLSYDEEGFIKTPLALTGLTIKYKIGGQIR